MNGIKYYPRIGILRLGKPLGGSGGKPAGRAATPTLEELNKYHLGKPSYGKQCSEETQDKVMQSLEDISEFYNV